ncbi:T9SS type A sorting domain-containing protein [Adhaeribacter radiodurans]|uniref:T9SS type A sorting domain-containing protein n=1 Tax=Adhaeribacter radiodurans TaxID=2745197 RepID=A0A7L7L7I2_9BACT|nr:T9SS type A sorting domain-containing protein [Adhaeribacter radiodurans]QMU28786.1 T9SS type A sorting domain-containing protein [Adhaeribacter radiodurans]
MIMPYRSKSISSLPLSAGWTAIMLLFWLLVTFSTQGQGKLWQNNFGGSKEDNLNSMQRTSDGGYILAGSSNSLLSGDKTEARRGDYDYWVVKLDANRNKVWDKTLGGEKADWLTSVHQTSDGGYILGGYSWSGKGGDKSEAKKGELDENGNPTSDYWVVKLKANGTKAWDRSFGGDNDDRLVSLQQTSDGGYILGGYSYSGKSGDKTEASRGMYDYWIVKLNANGTKAWDKTIGGVSSDVLTSMQQTSDGGYILGGKSGSGTSGDKSENPRGKCNQGYCLDDYWIVKLQADGRKVWDKTIGGYGADRLNSLQQTQDGGYLLGGTSWSGIGGDKSEPSKNDDYWIVKLQADGHKIWDKTIGEASDQGLFSAQQTSDGGYILAGSWMVKLDANRNKVWDTNISDNGQYSLTSLQLTSDGEYLLGGRSWSNTNMSEYWLAKLDNSSRLNQSITFSPIPDKTFGSEPFAITAQASSGLPITFRVISGNAAVKGNIVTITGVGEVIIEALQAGNATYIPATAKQTFFVPPTKKLWDITMGGNKPDKLTAMVPTPDGGYLVGGSSLSGKTGEKSEDAKGTPNEQGYYPSDFWLVKLDSQGKKMWDKAYGGDEADHLAVILPTPNGGYLLGGSSVSGKSGDKSQPGMGNTDFWLVKINATGQKLWDKTYGGSAADNLTSLLVTPDGGYLLGGSSYSGKSGDKSQASQGSGDYWLIKVDAEGRKVWDKSFGGSETDNLTAIVGAPKGGGYLIGGSSASEKSGDKSEVSRGLEDYWIVRLKEDGTKLWDKTLGGVKERYKWGDCPYEDPTQCVTELGKSILTALLATPDGGYLLGGYSSAEYGAEKTEDNQDVHDDNYYFDSEDYWVVKINSTGTKVWDKIYNGPVDCTLASIIPTPDGDYLLAGTSGAGYFEPGAEDYWLVKIDGEGTKKWDRTHGSLDTDELTAIVPTPDGSYLLAGSSAGGIGGNKTEASRDFNSQYALDKRDFWLVKVKEELPLTAQWDMRYGGSSNDGFSTIIKTSDGSYLSGGYSTSGVSGDKSQSSRGKNDYWIVKSDKNGKKEWDKRYGGSGDDYLNHIIPTKDGGYLLAGSSLSGKGGDKTEASHGDRDYWLVKIDKQGTKEWDKSYGGSGIDELKKVLQLSTGEYILAGNSNSPVSGDKTKASQGKHDFWLVKISSTGKKLWDQRYGGSLDEVLASIVQTANDGFLLGGSSWSSKSGNKTELSRGKSDFWLVQVDKNGNQLWDKTYGGTGQDEAYSVGKSGGTYFLAGQSDSPAGLDKTRDSQGGLDYWLLKVSSNGEKVWDKRYGGSKDDELRASIPTQDGGYLLAGKSFSNKSGNKRQDSQGSSDYWIVKANKEGQYEWSKTFGGSRAEELRAVIQTQEGGFLLGGKSESGVSGDRTQPSEGGTDYWLVKVATEKISIITEKEAIVMAEPVKETELSPITAYPNPGKDQVIISFTLPKSQTTTVKIYDSHGRSITTLFQGVAKAKQTYKLQWQADHQPAGMYLLQLHTSERTRFTKLLLVR